MEETYRLREAELAHAARKAAEEAARELARIQFEAAEAVRARDEKLQRVLDDAAVEASHAETRRLAEV